MNDHTLPSADDERYGTFALIRRLLTEQGLVHWRKYAVAFVLMAISAGCTALSAYLIGDVINQAYVNRNLPGIVILGGITAALFAIKGLATYGHSVMLSQHRQPHRRRQSARRVRQAAQRRPRLLLRPAFDRIHRAADRPAPRPRRR